MNMIIETVVSYIFMILSIFDEKINEILPHNNDYINTQSFIKNIAEILKFYINNKHETIRLLPTFQQKLNSAQFDLLTTTTQTKYPHFVTLDVFPNHLYLRNTMKMYLAKPRITYEKHQHLL